MGKITMDFSALFKRPTSSFTSMVLTPGVIIDKDLFPNSSKIKLRPKVWIIDSQSMLFGRKLIMNEEMLRREKERLSLSNTCKGFVLASGSLDSIKIRQGCTAIIYTLELTSDFNYKVISAETWEY